MANLELAHKNAQKGKKHYKEVKMVNANPKYFLHKIQKDLQNKSYKTSAYKVMLKKTSNGKIREIYKLPYFPDRIVHHAIMQIVEPIWFKSLIRDTYSAIKGRGIHDGVKRIKLGLRNKTETKYCLKMDVKKFYPSINNNVMKQVVRIKIKDQDLLWLLDEIIDSTQGLPIGNYLSQYLGNLYLNEYDHIMKEKKLCKYYYRYCDDIVVLASNKKQLHDLKEFTSEYLHDIKLRLKPNWQIFPVDSRGIDFLGYRFYHDYTLLRKSIAKRMKRKCADIKANYYKMSATHILSAVMSYLGWVKYANCKNLINSLFDDEIFWIVKHKSIEAGVKNPLQGAL